MAGTPITIAGQLVRCQHCGSERFWERRAQLNTAVLTFFNLDWLNKSARLLVCRRCGFVHWFLPSEGETVMDEESEPSMITENDDSPEANDSPAPCLKCGATIPSGVDNCPSCGWSYRS
jgi:hypothetical protein